MNNPHALIIDDNTTNLEVMAELLTALGVTYTIVQNPIRLGDVLETLEQLDVVFLDLEMPGMDGYTVFDILRHDYNITVPIVASTVHLNEIQTARELGFHSFLGKPLKISRFPNQLARILNNEPVWEIE